MAKTEKFTIIDDCLVPDRFVWVYYTGPNPWGVARHISARVREFFHVSASGTNNTRINWDVVGENINFYSVWWVKKNFSGYTTMYVDMNFREDIKKHFNLQTAESVPTATGTYG